MCCWGAPFKGCYPAPGAPQGGFLAYVLLPDYTVGSSIFQGPALVQYAGACQTRARRVWACSLSRGDQCKEAVVPMKTTTRLSNARSSRYSRPADPNHVSMKACTLCHLRTHGPCRPPPHRPQTAISFPRVQVQAGWCPGLMASPTESPIAPSRRLARMGASRLGTVEGTSAAVSDRRTNETPTAQRSRAPFGATPLRM